MERQYRHPGRCSHSRSVSLNTKPGNQEQKLAAEILKCRVTIDNRLDLLVKTFQSIVQKVATAQLLNHGPLFTKWVPIMLKVCAHTTRRGAQQLCT